MNFNEDQGRFLNQHQKLLFSKNLEDGTPSEKADIIRNIMFDLRTAQATNMLTEESCGLLLRGYENSYSAIVDSLDENTGLNNFAEGALSICSVHKNDSQNWTSSLTLDKIEKMDCMKTLLQTNKKISDRLLPPTYQNQVLISTATAKEESKSGFSFTNKNFSKGQQNIPFQHPSLNSMQHQQTSFNGMPPNPSNTEGLSYQNSTRLFGNYPKYDQNRNEHFGSGNQFRRSDTTGDNGSYNDGYTDVKRKPLFGGGPSNGKCI